MEPWAGSASTDTKTVDLALISKLTTVAGEHLFQDKSSLMDDSMTVPDHWNEARLEVENEHGEQRVKWLEKFYKIYVHFESQPMYWGSIY